MKIKKEEIKKLLQDFFDVASLFGLIAIVILFFLLLFKLLGIPNIR